MSVVFRGAGALRVDPADRTILRLLRDRDREGYPSEVVLRDGSRLLIYNISWGYDPVTVAAQVTTNISPSVRGALVEVFSTHAVVAVNDPETGDPLLAVA
ncbi:hypothetical protein [Nocardia stercoris]|uniref:Uncharacterized protein n=1 Tax=Nocardia stercoris TaxID=2483361 RepID=A0A3M2KWU9_9NOCA|nr:hypothetical protein [Nocardia stercoris]RMI29106.1 hypothetical protein EBN03_27110 [Nocardia stercoris]